MDANENRDLLAEWLKLGREVLAKCFPESPYATLVIPTVEGAPDTVLCVTPLPRSTSTQPTPRPS